MYGFLYIQCGRSETRVFADYNTFRVSTDSCSVSLEGAILLNINVVCKLFRVITDLQIECGRVGTRVNVVCTKSLVSTDSCSTSVKALGIEFILVVRNFE